MTDQAPNPTPVADAKDVAANAFMAALSYVWFFSIVVALTKKESPLAQFHARQGILLAIIETVGFLIPPLMVFNVIAVIIAIVGFIKALKGEMWEIPYIGQYAKKINL